MNILQPTKVDTENGGFKAQHDQHAAQWLTKVGFCKTAMALAAQTHGDQN